MPYNFATGIFYTKKLCSIVSSSYDFTWKTAVLRFWAPLWGLRSNVRWSS